VGWVASVAVLAVMVAVMLAALVVMAGCQGGGASADSRAAGKRPRTAPGRPLSGNAAIAGGVYLTANPPPRSGSPTRTECIPSGAPAEFDPALRRASSGEVAGVFVWLLEGAPIVPLEAGTAPAEVAVDDCGFHPRTSAARVGQALRLTNRGDQHRTVVARDDKGTLFEITVAPGSSAVTPPFSRAAATARLVSSEEPAARGYVGVVEHPFFAVTDTTGAFALTHLPGGAFAVAAWHEVLGQIVHRVTVEDGGMIIVDFPFQSAQMSGGAP
jgi:hypothetical protein